MTFIYVLIALVGVVAVAALAAHFLPKSSNAKLATLETDLNRLYERGFPVSGTPAPVGPGTPPASKPPVVAVPLLTPITPAEYVAAALRVSSGTSYRSGAAWNQIAWLKSLSAFDFATWCAALAAQPECVQALGAGVEPSVLNSASTGWILGLSQQGQGIVDTLDGQGLPIPDVDPRIALAPK